jgi:hypothetical protein
MAPMPPHAAVKETGDGELKKQQLQKWLDENQYSRQVEVSKYFQLIQEQL